MDGSGLRGPMETRALYDLHLHTTASDGKLTPRELVRAAKSSRLRAFAVTDHDTVEGIPEAMEEASALGIELIPGVEVSANFGDAAVHVLGLFIEYREPWLANFFSEASRRRIERVHEMVRKLVAARHRDRRRNRCSRARATAQWGVLTSPKCSSPGGWCGR